MFSDLRQEQNSSLRLSSACWLLAVLAFSGVETGRHGRWRASWLEVLLAGFSMRFTYNLHTINSVPFFASSFPPQRVRDALECPRTAMSARIPW